MAKIDDVARLAGVSTATVSRALRGLPVVSEETRARVVHAATTLGYVASPSASRLAGGRTGSVGMVVPRFTRWFFATVMEAADETLRRAGCDIVLYNVGGRERAWRASFYGQALHQRVDAVMLVATPLEPADVSALARLPLPGVTVSSGTPVPGWPSIRVDDVAAARVATEHLIGLGHTRIAHIAGNALDHLAFTTHVDRRVGYQQALRAAGIPLDPALDIEADFTVRGGERAARTLLDRARAAGTGPPTAFFAACDEMAMGALRVLREAGLRIPQDVSVIGIDDHDVAAVVGLTTVAQPAKEQGTRAAARLLDALRDGAAGQSAGGSELLPTHLVVRSSTGPPPAGER